MQPPTRTDAQRRRPAIDGDVPRDLHQSPDPGERMQAGVDLAVALLPGCDHAGITLVDGERISSGAATDDVVARADAIQRDVREGPCVDAARLQERIISVPDLTRDPRWPNWARRVTQELAVRSLLSLLLYTEDRSFGALSGTASGPRRPSPIRVAPPRTPTADCPRSRRIWWMTASFPPQAHHETTGTSAADLCTTAGRGGRGRQRARTRWSWPVVPSRRSA